MDGNRNAKSSMLLEGRCSEFLSVPPTSSLLVFGLLNLQFLL